MHTFYVLTDRVVESIRAHFHDSESFSLKPAPDRPVFPDRSLLS